MKIKVHHVEHAWMAVWEQTNRLDGHTRYLMPRLTARTKHECRAKIRERYNYLARRGDLSKEPHCWRMPKPVRVTITTTED